MFHWKILQQKRQIWLHYNKGCFNRVCSMIVNAIKVNLSQFSISLKYYSSRKKSALSPEFALKTSFICGLITKKKVILQKQNKTIWSIAICSPYCNTFLCIFFQCFVKLLRINCVLLNLYLVDYTHGQGQASVLLNNESINESRRQNEQKYLIHETQGQTFCLGWKLLKAVAGWDIEFLVFTCYLWGLMASLNL